MSDMKQRADHAVQSYTAASVADENVRETRKRVTAAVLAEAMRLVPALLRCLDGQRYQCVGGKGFALRLLDDGSVRVEKGFSAKFAGGWGPEYSPGTSDDRELLEGIDAMIERVQERAEEIKRQVEKTTADCATLATRL